MTYLYFRGPWAPIGSVPLTAEEKEPQKERKYLGSFAPFSHTSPCCCVIWGAWLRAPHHTSRVRCQPRDGCEDKFLILSVMKTFSSTKLCIEYEMLVYRIVSQKNPKLTLVQDVLYLICRLTILSRTLSIIPITICGRLPFPVLCISLIPFSQYRKSFFSNKFSHVHKNFIICPQEPTRRRFRKTSRVDLRTRDCQRNISFAICNKRHNSHRHKRVRRETQNVHTGSECLFELPSADTFPLYPHIA